MKNTNFDLRRSTDSYKVSHAVQYPKGTAAVYEYVEGRGSQYGCAGNVFFGLQYYLKHYLQGQVVDAGDIERAVPFFAKHFGSDGIFQRDRWMHVLEKHGGRLPLEIKAVREGTFVPLHNVMMTVTNTCADCFWLPGWFETILMRTWYPITIASNDFYNRVTIEVYLAMTGGKDSGEFKLHDFGGRGVSSAESAAIGGAAHLVHFKGTDTLDGLVMLQDYYHADVEGFSIPAAEHSTMTAWKRVNELNAYENMLNQFPTGMVAVVSDSYDLMGAIKQHWGTALRQRVLERDGVVVVRPDSGPPETFLPLTLDALGEAFGHTTNEKGFKVLDPHVRVIWGDGIKFQTLPKILQSVMDAKWCIDNVAFGSGSGLLQEVTRDDYKMAMKASAIFNTDEGWYGIQKSPVDDASKASKAGRFMLLVNEDGLPHTIEYDEKHKYADMLELAFLNGDVMRDQSFASVREEAQVT